MRFVKLYADSLAEKIKADPAERKYRPSNGTEGMMFMEAWCEHCAKFLEAEAGAGQDCDIVTRTFWLDEKDKDYPAEWTYNEGQPCCTAFEDKPAGGVQ